MKPSSSPPSSSTPLLLLAAAYLPMLINAAAAPTSTTKTNIWIPPLPTTRGEEIYASVLDADDKTTTYLLSCAPNFSSSVNCAGRYTGVRVTHASDTMQIAYGATTFSCDRTPTASCLSITPSGVPLPGSMPMATGTVTLASAESARWATEITIVEGHDKLGGKHKSTSTAQKASPTDSDNELCKRSSSSSSGGGGGKSGSGGGGGSGGSDDGSSGGSSGSGSGGSSSGGKSGSSSGRKKDGCNAASAQGVDVRVLLAAGLGAGVAVMGWLW